MFISHTGTFSSYLILFINGLYIYNKEKKNSFIFTQVSAFSSILEAKSNLRSNQILAMSRLMMRVHGRNHDFLLLILDNAVICEPGTTRSHLDAFSNAVPKAHTGHLVHCSTDTHLPQSAHLANDRMPSATLSILYINWIFHPSTSEDGVTILPR